MGRAILVIGWGSTRGAIEEAVDGLRAEGAAVSSMHLKFLQPCPGHRREADEALEIDSIGQRPSGRRAHRRVEPPLLRALAMLLRARYLVDVDCWSEVKGQPIKPSSIRESRSKLASPRKQSMTDHAECLLRLHDERFELEDYQSGVPRWCSGCGDNAILAAVQKLCRDERLHPEKTVFVSGIGCSSRFPHYKTYGFHGIHGRALPIAEGVRMARPDLHVFVNTGDGDCCSIGAAHWVHAVRYNMNLTMLLHDNEIYGLTKKQASPPRPAAPGATPRRAARSSKRSTRSP